jgi:signal transduction histidine kinase
MQLTNPQLEMVLVFFVYGLAFFSLGIALTLETGRAPLLVEKRILLPLAVFGLLHGAHEWMEIILLQGIWLGLPFPPIYAWLRVILLNISFLPLVLFGLLLLLPDKPFKYKYLIILAGLLILDFSLVAWNAQIDPQNLIARMDALARYILAVPGGVLAGLALLHRARQISTENHLLSGYFKWAALGIGLYGLTQIFVPASGMFPAKYVNVQIFQDFTRLPIQVLRASLAIVITINLIRAIHAAEKERQNQLLAAQKARVKALEQVQGELIERESLRRELLRHIVIAQEEERARIARELHDQTAQELTAFSLNLATLRNALPRRSEVVELASRLQELCGHMSQGLYRMVRDLRPAQLDDLGLVSALKYLADEARDQLNLEISVDVLGTRQRLDPLIETVVFRVAQEALNNVSRHAYTDCAVIHLVFEPDCVILQVQDSGVGFDVNENLSPPRGWGLAGMRERAESLDGELHLQSVPGHGTAIQLVIPLNQSAEDKKILFNERISLLNTPDYLERLLDELRSEGEK